MPDPERKTVSASQTAALWNASPYMTRWMLWNRFKHGLADDEPETSRMRWGKLIEPLVIEEVAREWKLEVYPNVDHDESGKNVRQVYYRRGLVGATRDATIIAPGKGPGAVEVKCVFDYPTWMQDWDGGRRVPRHHEIQLQTQMYVGDGDTAGGKPYQWGLLVAWVCAGAELYYFEREPIIPLWHEFERESVRFFKSIEHDEEPEAFGDPIEIPFLTSLYQTDKAVALDLSGKYENVKLAEDLRLYHEFKQQKTATDRVCDEYRTKFLALAKEAGEVLLPCGFKYRIQKVGRGKTIVPLVPEVPDPPPLPESVLASE